MTLQNTIHIIRYSTIASALLFFASVPFYFMSFKDVIYIILYGLAIALAAVVALCKGMWTRYMLRKVKYPGVLYGVCESMGYIRNLNINPSDDVLNDLYQPTWDTDTFLSDNQLDAHVYKVAPIAATVGTALYIVPMAATLYLRKTGAALPVIYATLLITAAGAVIIAAYLKTLKDKTGMPVYFFSPEGLRSSDVFLPWHNLYSWETIVSKGRGESTVVQCRLGEAINDQLLVNLSITGLAVSPTDFNILLTHYKYKYGYAMAQA